MTLPPITIQHYLALSALLFCLGLIGITVRRNLLIVFMCLEVLMNAVNLSFVALARYFSYAELARYDGQVIAIFVMAIAAVEVAIGLGIVIAIFRNKQTVNTSDLMSLKG